MHMHMLFTCTDMAIYGELPVSDCLSLVVCRKCNRVIKSEALIKHKG